MKISRSFYVYTLMFFLFMMLMLFFNININGNDEIWYRISLGAAQSNIIKLSNKTDKGFQLHADCINGANLGEFKGYFIFVSDTTAVYSGESIDGIVYKINANFDNKNMIISFDSSNITSEWDALGFGNIVTISGEYSQEKPNYDYSDLVMEKVFLSDYTLAEKVKKHLGKKQFEIFIYNFGMSNNIYLTEKNGYKVVKGLLLGIGDWCSFSTDKNGFFYGIYNDVYFTNDPIYKDTIPDFLK